MNNTNLPLHAQNQYHREKLKSLEISNAYLKEMSETLKADIELAKQQAEKAEKDSRFSKIVSIIAIIISIISIVCSFFN